MPIPIRSRRYDEKFWQEIHKDEKPLPETTAGFNKLLGFGDDDTD
jgi:hypothetical protein